MSAPGSPANRAQRIWVSLAVLVLIVLVVYATARVLTAMGDRVPPPREPLPSTSVSALPES